MSKMKELIEHIARRHWEHGQGGQWDVPAGIDPAAQPFPAYADEQQKNQYRAYATQLLSDAPILADVMKDEQLRELLSYCRSREEYKGRDNEIGADTAYGDVADKLAAILDGEQ